MAKMGRPVKVVDWEEFDKLCYMQCTEEEIAAWFQVSIETINEKVKEKFNLTFLEYSSEKRKGGRISLRRAQLKVAMGDNGIPPNPTMLIWLGKQYLAQSDKNSVDVSSTTIVLDPAFLKELDDGNNDKR